MRINSRDKTVYDITGIGEAEYRVIMLCLSGAPLTPENQKIASALYSQMDDYSALTLPDILQMRINSDRGPSSFPNPPLSESVFIPPGTPMKYTSDDFPETIGMCKQHDFIRDEQTGYCAGELWPGQKCMRMPDDPVHNMEVGQPALRTG